MGNYLKIDSLNTLINAIGTYQDELSTNRQILLNAANVCDVAMGSDANVQRHIAKLNEALIELQKTAQIAEEVTEALIADRQKALETLED